MVRLQVDLGQRLHGLKVRRLGLLGLRLKKTEDTLLTELLSLSTFCIVTYACVAFTFFFCKHTTLQHLPLHEAILKAGGKIPANAEAGLRRSARYDARAVPLRGNSIGKSSEASLKP